MTKLPGYCVLLGLVFYASGLLAKDFLPRSVGSHPLLQIPCAFFSAVFTPFGSLLALQRLILNQGLRRDLLNWFMLGLIFGFLILSQYFMAEAFESHLLSLSQTQNFLPKLIENTETMPTEKKRISLAREAYILYGVTIAYQNDYKQLAFFEPNSEDELNRQKVIRSEGRALQLKLFYEKVTSEFPYLFGLYTATYSTTFITGWIWILFKVPKLPEKIFLET